MWSDVSTKVRMEHNAEACVELDSSKLGPCCHTCRSYIVLYFEKIYLIYIIEVRKVL